MKVTVYSTTTCPYCVMVKRWLNDKGIKFEDVLVDRDVDAARKMVELSGQMGVPFTWIEDENQDAKGVLGYDPGSLSRALHIA